MEADNFQAIDGSRYRVHMNTGSVYDPCTCRQPGSSQCTELLSHNPGSRHATMDRSARIVDERFLITDNRRTNEPQTSIANPGDNVPRRPCRDLSFVLT